MYLTTQKINLDRIVIPPYMSQPTTKELNRMSTNYKNGNLLGNIIIDKDYILRDGYANYLIAQKNLINYTEVLVINFDDNDYKERLTAIKLMAKNNCNTEKELLDKLRIKSKGKLAQAKRKYNKNPENAWSGRIDQARRYSVYMKANGKCPICGNELLFMVGSPEKHHFTIDHNTPKCLGGKNTSENCIAMCQRCNEIKDNIMPDVFKNLFQSAMAEEALSNPGFQNLLIKKILKSKIIQCIYTIKTAIL